MNKLKIARKYMKKENKKWPAEPVPVPPEKWPQLKPPSGAKVVAVWRSKKYVIQQYVEKSGANRLTICRTILGDDGDWGDNITWDELQQIKAAVGFGDCWAVELFPPDDNVVNVANMRHLWILPSAPDFGW